MCCGKGIEAACPRRRLGDLLDHQGDLPRRDVIIPPCRALSVALTIIENRRIDLRENW
jgi:hypothetical protein